MKKITDFIIDKRNFILFLFIIFTIIFGILSNKVNINYDMSKYLKDTSETRIGMNIMDKEFSSTETSNLNLMFEDLKEVDKLNIKEELEEIDGVKEVDYDNTENYNKNNYTLYVITVNGKSDSKMAKDVYNKINENYKDYSFYMSGEIEKTNKSVLPLWIIALAVFCTLIILLIMCESLVEPFLFLISILMAVVLNMGTNIIFPSVSHITNSIAAILQMALSMDYSIMLMNRYDQEKEAGKDKVRAMKDALHKAFLSISSSSITTIVGLLALIFMSFKIGKDLGLILAKGVLFSLICIFFVLPALILMFDKAIIKTKKKSPSIKLNRIGKLSYKFRMGSLPLFLIVFVVSFMLKGNLGIDYTDRQEDKISKVFKENNQIAIIYKNKDEKKIKQFFDKLENDKKIDEVLGYGNTINQRLTYNKLKDKLDDLGSNVSIEDYLLRIIYYDYYNEENNNKMSFEEFVNFIEQEAYNNVKINEKIDDSTKRDITRLKNFVTESNIDKKRTAKEIADILEIDENNVDDMFVYYNSLNNNLNITLEEFVNFMDKDVLTDKNYAARIDKESINKLNTLSKFIDKEIIQKKISAEEMANIFGIDVNIVKDLYKYYILTSDIDLKMSISDFSNFVLNNILNDKDYANSFNEETIQSIKLLATFSNKSIINKEMNSKELENLLGIEESKVKQILLLKYLHQENKSTYTIKNLVDYITIIKTQSHYLDDLDVQGLEKIKENSDLINNKTKYSVEIMANILGMDIVQINQIYNLIDYITGNTNNWIITPLDFVNIIVDNYDNESIKDNIDITNFNKLKLLQLVMISSNNEKKFTYQELASMINIDSNSIKSIYALYIYQNVTVLTPQEFVAFILDHQSDSVLSNNISKDTIKNLTLIKNIMNGVLRDTKYTSSGLSNLLGIDKDNLNLLYGLYNSIYINKNQTISLKDFIDFILNNVITNQDYSSNFDTEKISKLNTVKAIMNNSLNNVKYTSDEIFAIITKLSNKTEKNMIEILYTYYGSNNQYDEAWDMTVEEFVDYLNNNILQDNRFIDFIDEDIRKEIIEAKDTIKDAKELLVGNNYSRIVLNTKLDLESQQTFDFIQDINNMLGTSLKEYYVIGDSTMAYEMNKSFNNELNLITVITMGAIFAVVAITFKSAIIPIILVLTIQCAVYLTMGILSFTGENVYFISILIVQSILMGATIDYAILYTSYYLEHRKKLNIKESIIESYNKAIHTILTSSSILIIVTLIIACFASAIAAKICKTISEGTICSTLLILILLPAVIACCDRFIVKKNK